MTFMGLSSRQKKALELEVVSREARLQLTRHIRWVCQTNDIAIQLIRTNHYINVANTVMGKPIYRLESDDWGEYQSAEYAWHQGELELIFRRPSTIELAAILADFIQNEMITDNVVNKILSEDGCSFTFGKRDDEVTVEIAKLSDIPEETLSGDHPNIRKLVERMDRAVQAKDPSAVLHTAASIIETLAKDILADVNVENQSLGAFFERYRRVSQLPDAILDYMIDIFKSRNITPLAGHGNTAPPKIEMKQMVPVAELTKAFVRMERSLALLETTAKGEAER